MKHVGISLGANCGAAARGKFFGVRASKKEGYKTCPFDLILSNYPGILKCLREDFKHFTNPEYLNVVDIPSDYKHLAGNKLIFNSYYKFFFNHESPVHADFHIKENWPGGMNHFIDNNYEKFIERYERRINNFREYIKSDGIITFLLVRYNTDNSELEELLDSICTNAESLELAIVNMEFETKDLDKMQGDKERFFWNLQAMGFSPDSEELSCLKEECEEVKLL